VADWWRLESGSWSETTLTTIDPADGGVVAYDVTAKRQAAAQLLTT